jgi:hypothetical protein
MQAKLYGEAKRDEKSQKTQDVNYEHSSAALLANEPEDPNEQKLSSKETSDWNVLKGHLEARLISLRMWRNSWWTQNWSTLAQYLLPRRSIWLTQSTGGIPTPNNMTRGRLLNDSIKDPTGTFAVRVCAAGLMSGMASPSRPWFKITPKVKNFKPDADGLAWMDEVESRIYTVLAGSNFYNSFAQECEDLVVFGTAPCIIYEDEKDLIRCYNPANGEYYLASGATLRVDGLFRQFVMTISQIVDFFGIDNCSEDVVQLWKAKGNSLDTERIIGHAIEPNYEVKGVGKIPGNFTYREVYWMYAGGSQKPLSMRGFVECPFTATRWATQSNDAYGRSPGMDVLPDVIQLQVMTVRLSEAIEKQVRPPLIADISMKNQPSSALPGHVTYAADIGSGKGMRSIYEVNPDIKGLAGLIQQIEVRIGKGLFNDLFLMLSENPTQKQTAYEVAQKINEKMQVLGPVIENLIGDSLKPKLRTIYGIMSRKNMLPPMPDSMKGIPLDIEFTSLLSLAQNASKTGGMERIASLVGNLVAVYPEAKHLLNVTDYVKIFNDMLDNPHAILNSDDVIKQMTAAEQQQQAQAQKMQAAQHMATTAQIGSQAAANLANTQVGAGSNALQTLLGGQQSGSFNG